jgi:hypothetical protein
MVEVHEEGSRRVVRLDSVTRLGREEVSRKGPVIEIRLPVLMQVVCIQSGAVVSEEHVSLNFLIAATHSSLF